MGAIEWRAVPPAEPHPGVVARRVDGAHSTVVRYEFAGGARYPLHTHDEEQVLVVLEGWVEMREGDRTTRLGPGAVVVTAPGVPHGVTAPAGRAVALNVIVPRRSGAVRYVP